MALKILDLIDHDYCQRRERVPDNIARMLEDVRHGGDRADEIFENYARIVIGKRDQKGRRKAIAYLEAAFKIELAALKRYLKERTICNQGD